METTTYNVEEEEIQQDLLYLRDKLSKLNGGIQQDSDNSNYLSLFKDDHGYGLYVQPCSKDAQRYAPTIVKSHNYLIYCDNSINSLRPSCGIAISPQFCERCGGNKNYFRPKKV